MKKNIKTYLAVFVALAVAAVFYELNLSSSFVTLSPKAIGSINSSILGEEFPRIAVSNIEGIGQAIKIDSVVLGKGGFVIIRKLVNQTNLPIVGVSSYILNGVGNNIIIILNETPQSGELFMANFYLDDGDKIFSLDRDIPLLNEEKELQSVSVNF